MPSLTVGKKNSMAVESLLPRLKMQTGSGFFGEVKAKEISLPQVKKTKRQTYSYKDKGVYGFGRLNSSMQTVGGSFYVPPSPQVLTVIGTATICGLDEEYNYVEEVVSNGETKSLFFRVIGVYGDAEVLSVSALVAKTELGAWRNPTWSTGLSSVTMSKIFIHTRANMASIQLLFVNYLTGKVELVREFHTDMAQFQLPDSFVVPPNTDVVWLGSCGTNGGWASVSFVINATYAS